MAKSKKLVKKNKLSKVKNPDCLNCGYPFSGYEVFCPECGQKNKGNKLTFVSFIKEVFNGFVSWDAKFWRTIVPLLIKPGKVSKDYVEGKRNRYSNPFRFYLTVSIIFFLIVGATSSYNKFKDLQNGNPSKKINGTTFTINQNGIQAKTNKISLDSIQDNVYKQIEISEKKKDSVNALVKRDSLSQKQKDSILKASNVNNPIDLPFGNSDEIGKYLLFQKKHPTVTADEALDSLKIEKNFKNRFWYSRAGFINNMINNNKETGQNFYKEMLSYTSVALFILLPLFTLFLRLIYVRRKFTYVEHLIFVFHVQTVFFLLFSIFYLVGFFRDAEYIIPSFLLLFLIYLFIAMKRFYGQGFFKTFFKFLLANLAYFILGIIGSTALAFIAFAVS